MGGQKSMIDICLYYLLLILRLNLLLVIIFRLFLLFFPISTTFLT